MRIEKQSQSVFFVGRPSYGGRLGYLECIHEDNATAAVLAYVRQVNSAEYGKAVDAGDDVRVFEGINSTVFKIAELDPEREIEEILEDAVANA